MKVALRINGNKKSAVELEPDIIYRIGSRLGLEFHSDDGSIELAHATIALTAGGVVRLSAVTGIVFVNGLETGNEIKSISVTDAVNGLVNLRFGNLAAKLYFGDVNHLDSEACDASGFEDDQKDKSTYTTADSFIIHETEPNSINTTGNGESFVVPETQAPNFNRSSIVAETQAVKFNRSSMFRDESTGEDFVIPETQDVPLHINSLIQMEQNGNTNSATEDETSEMGTQIRICTQDFNEFDEDAIDDFDSSILLGDGGLGELPQLNQRNDKSDAADFEVSALNWSASNSKCTTVNSTKAGNVSTCSDVCLTPDLSVAGQRSEDVPCTPDIFDLLDVAANESALEPNEIADVNSESNPDDTQQLCGAKQPVVASIETPEATPREHDINETLAVSSQNTTSAHSKLDESDDSMQEFLEMQAFVKAKHLELSKNNNGDLVRPQPTMPQPSESSATRFSVTAQIHNNYEDFIETQIFPGRSPINCSSPNTKGNKTQDILLNNIEDFIETQIFPTKPIFNAPSPKTRNNLEDLIETQPFQIPTKTSMPKSSASLNSTAEIHNNIEDMIETQLFIPPANISDEDPDCENDCLQDSVNLSMRDELDKELKELIQLSPMENTPTDYMLVQNKFVFDADTNKKMKTSQGKELINTSDCKQKAVPNTGRKRSAALSSSPQLSPSKNKQSRQKSKSPTLPDEAAAQIKTSTRARKKSPTLPDEEAVEIKTSKRSRKRRPSVSNVETIAPPKKKKDQTTQPAVDTSEPDINARPKRGRLGKTCSVPPQLSESLEEPNTGSTHQSEDSIREVKVIIRRHNLNRSDNESASSSKNSKEEKSKAIDDQLRGAEVPKLASTPVAEVTKPVSKDIKERISKAKDDQPSVAEVKKPVSRSTRNKPQIDDAITEANNTEQKNTNLNITVNVDKLLSAQELTSSSNKLKDKAPKEKTKASSKKNLKGKEVNSSENLQEEKLTTSAKALAKDKLLAEKELSSSSNKLKHKAPKEKTKVSSKKVEKGKDVNSNETTQEEEPTTSANALAKQDKLLADKELSSSSSKLKDKIPKENTKASRKKNVKGKDVNSSETTQEEEPTTSAIARKSTRTRNIPKKDPLKDINDYIKKIKTAGQKIKVSLTMCNNAELHTVLSYLRNNVEITNDPLTCDALVMDKGERTYKFLVAIASNKPILSSRWLYSLKETRSIVVQPDHIFRDDNFEELFKFKPLSVFDKPSLLKGIGFMLGNEIQPNAKEMKAIIQCAGGTVYNRSPSIASKLRLYVVTSKKEKQTWVHLRNYTNVQYIKTESVMQALLQLNLELLDEHTLSF